MKALSISIALVLLTGGSSITLATDPGAPLSTSYRSVPIPVEFYSYQYLPPISFVSNSIEFKSLLDSIKSATGDICESRTRTQLDTLLRGISVDFKTEALVLIRDIQGSGSVKVQLDPPTINNDTLRCIIKYDTPKGFMTFDMSYRCFAFIVNKSKIKGVKVDWETVK